MSASCLSSSIGKSQSNPCSVSFSLGGPLRKDHSTALLVENWVLSGQQFSLIIHLPVSLTPLQVAVWLSLSINLLKDNFLSSSCLALSKCPETDTWRWIGMPLTSWLPGGPSWRKQKLFSMQITHKCRDSMGKAERPPVSGHRELYSKKATSISTQTSMVHPRNTTSLKFTANKLHRKL